MDKNIDELNRANNKPNEASNLSIMLNNIEEIPSPKIVLLNVSGRWDN